MRYIPPFEAIKEQLSLTTIRGRLVASAPFDDLRAMIWALLEGVDVDEP